VLLGLLFALWVPPLVGLEARWGAAGLTASAGMAGWVEFYLLRRSMNLRIGRTGIAAPHLARLWGAALLAAGAGWSLLQAVEEWAPVPRACIVLGGFAAAYLGITALLGVDEVREVAGRFRRMAGRGT
jgi:putative peptidoglycan lipid II flippase